MREAAQTLCCAFCRDESGGTAMEYALIVAGIAITAIASIQAVGVETNNSFENVAASFPTTP